MARARNIKPGFFKNEQLVELPFSTRLLFIGLWTLADREGRLEDRPKRIKMEVFPGDSVDVDKALAELDAEGFIERYEVAGDLYIQIIAFCKHQNPHPKEPVSSIPAHEPCNYTASNGNSTASRVKVRPSRADSPSLIPDSLLPDSPSPIQAKAKGGRAVALPDWLPVEPWKAWLEVRTKNRAPNTERALALAVGLLERLRADGQDVGAVLEQSTLRGWRGLFPVKVDGAKVDVDKMIREIEEEEKKRVAH